MKKSILLALALVSFSVANAQEATKTKAVKKVKKSVESTKKQVDAKIATPALPQVDGPGMVFETETIDYGTIEHNANGAREFVLTNNGNKPLIISNAQGSCGCTVPTWPKEPIAPGAKAVIGVKYATDRVGPISKSITLTTNVKGQESKVIFIKGTVLPDPAPAAAPIAPKS